MTTSTVHRPHIDHTWTPHWPYPQLFFHHHISIVFLHHHVLYCFPLPPPYFYCFLSTTTITTFPLFSSYTTTTAATTFPLFPSSTTTTTTFLMFSLHYHHHHHHIPIVFPPLPPLPPPHFSCFSASDFFVLRKPQKARSDKFCILLLWFFVTISHVFYEWPDF